MRATAQASWSDPVAIAEVTELMWSKITGGQLFQSPPKSMSWSEPLLSDGEHA
jgi:hypothetical protein